MDPRTLIQLAQDLEWLGCELEYYGQRHAHEGFPQSGPTWDAFLEKQRGVLATADKLERELKSQITFNPNNLVGVDYPLDAAFEAIGQLLAAIEEIKQCAVFTVQELPGRVRALTRQVEAYVVAVGLAGP